ncbi:unnamed protein product [Owenia fusiformis]|uniref:Uncharacterized protein n=1 Tax=Owenia fusiformis TaxID=6347 RepID=A0A8S4PV57_OWEFU|nr:unnamed protein product [Owenia fusiformis]
MADVELPYFNYVVTGFVVLTCIALALTLAGICVFFYIVCKRKYPYNKAYKVSKKTLQDTSKYFHDYDTISSNASKAGKTSMNGSQPKKQHKQRSKSNYDRVRKGKELYWVPRRSLYVQNGRVSQTSRSSTTPSRSSRGRNVREVVSARSKQQNPHEYSTDIEAPIQSKNGTNNSPRVSKQVAYVEREKLNNPQRNDQTPIVLPISVEVNKSSGNSSYHQRDTSNDERPLPTTEADRVSNEPIYDNRQRSMSSLDDQEKSVIGAVNDAIRNENGYAIYDNGSLKYPESLQSTSAFTTENHSVSVQEETATVVHRPKNSLSKVIARPNESIRYGSDDYSIIQKGKRGNVSRKVSDSEIYNIRKDKEKDLAMSPTAGLRISNTSTTTIEESKPNYPKVTFKVSDIVDENQYDEVAKMEPGTQVRVTELQRVTEQLRVTEVQKHDDEQLAVQEEQNVTGETDVLNNAERISLHVEPTSIPDGAINAGMGTIDNSESSEKSATESADQASTKEASNNVIKQERQRSLENTKDQKISNGFDNGENSQRPKQVRWEETEGDASILSGETFESTGDMIMGLHRQNENNGSWKTEDRSSFFSDDFTTDDEAYSILEPILSRKSVQQDPSMSESIILDGHPKHTSVPPKIIREGMSAMHY